MIPTILQTYSEKEREKEEENSKVYSRNSSNLCIGKATHWIFSAMANVVFFDSKLLFLGVDFAKEKIRNRKVRHNPNRSDCSQMAKLTPGERISDFDDSNINSLILSSASSLDSSFSSSTLSGFNWEKEVKQSNGSVGSLQSNLQDLREQDSYIMKIVDVQKKPQPKPNY
ncbi:hypothetical protein NE237_010208 [Protea cynaroides]|uniref:Uncharacterized protein n=1 Tax=Protea cynaroides TaxID=273540 RepID=A0A9Q0KZ48_9MAGN|nr:hypothetical protein NE237_010208 [Protea cynaroides]